MGCCVSKQHEHMLTVNDCQTYFSKNSKPVNNDFNIVHDTYSQDASGADHKFIQFLTTLLNVQAAEMTNAYRSISVVHNGLSTVYELPTTRTVVLVEHDVRCIVRWKFSFNTALAVWNQVHSCPNNEVSSNSVNNAKI